MSRLPPRMRVDRGERAAATPETLAKRRPDILVEWFQGGIIGEDELAAGRQIRAMWAVLSPVQTRGRGDPLGYKTATVVLKERTAYYDGLSVLGDFVHAEVWMPWGKIQGRRLLPALGYHTPLKVILDTVIENEPTPHVDLVADGLAMWHAMMEKALAGAAKAAGGPAGRAAAPAGHPRA